MTDSIAPISPTSQSNFLPRNLRPGTEAFFNSKEFMDNEIRILTWSVNHEKKVQEKGFHQIKDSIEGST